MCAISKASVYIILGASGSGKTTCLQYLHEKYSFNLIEKQTTRKRRQNDGSNIISVKKISSECDIRYTQYGIQYGFSSSDIWSNLRNDKNCAIVVNDVRTIRLIKRRLGALSVCLFLQSNIDKDKLLEIEKSRYNLHSDNIILAAERRAEKIKSIHRKYIEHSVLFDHVLLNVGTIKELTHQLDVAVSFGSNKHLISKVSSKIFIICGNSFSEKDSLVNAMREMHPEKVEIYRKATTRPERSGDNKELRHIVNNEKLSEFDLVYTKQSHEYAISIQELWKLLEANKVILLVLNDFETISKISQKFRGNCVTLYLHSSNSKDSLLKNSAWTEDENRRRIKVSEELFKEYASKFPLFDHVLLNTAALEDLYDQAMNIYDYHIV